MSWKGIKRADIIFLHVGVSLLNIQNTSRHTSNCICSHIYLYSRCNIGMGSMDSTALHSTALHSTAQHCTAQHSTAQRKWRWGLRRRGALSVCVCVAWISSTVTTTHTQMHTHPNNHHHHQHVTHVNETFHPIPSHLLSDAGAGAWLGGTLCYYIVIDCIFTRMQAASSRIFFAE